MAALSLSDGVIPPGSAFPFPVPAKEGSAAKGSLSAHRELLSGVIGHSGPRAFLL